MDVAVGLLNLHAQNENSTTDGRCGVIRLRSLVAVLPSGVFADDLHRRVEPHAIAAGELNLQTRKGARALEY
jgi:hypothetical protein